LTWRPNSRRCAFSGVAAASMRWSATPSAPSKSALRRNGSMSLSKIACRSPFVRNVASKPGAA
jgi:hypothetical protein